MGAQHGCAPACAVLIYDASCPLCRKAVAAVGESCYPGAFEFLPCGAEETVRRYPQIDPADCLRAIQVVLPDGRTLAGGAAAPVIVERLPRYRWAAPLLRLPAIRYLVSLAYRVVARNRRRLGHLLFP
jgi:predicted DCC family thiol-disulfide oxidoreductase YuxK